MKKSNFLLLIILVLLTIVGCGHRQAVKVIDSEYIKKNDGIIFKNYAIAIDEEVKEKQEYALFKIKNTGRYKKMFSISKYTHGDKLLATDKYIYFFAKEGGIVGYELNNGKLIEANFENIDGLIYFPIDIYGFENDYIYISYYESDKKDKVLYAKISADLKSYVKVENKEDIPKTVKNYIEK